MTSLVGTARLEERQLERWIVLNLTVLEGYSDGAIEYTDDALTQLRSL